MEGNKRLARPIQEVSGLFSVSTDTLRRAAIRGDLRVIRVGRRMLVPEEEVERISREGLGCHAAK
jgi:excisionase family DNA binding protein